MEKMNKDSVTEMDSLKEVSKGSDSGNLSCTINTNCIESDAPVKNCVNNGNVIDDKLNNQSGSANQPTKDISKTMSLSYQVDEDEVLADDETGSKEFDGNNIDEDELLKDTEADNNVIESRSTFPQKDSNNSTTNENFKLNEEKIVSLNGPNNIINSGDKESINEDKGDGNNCINDLEGGSSTETIINRQESVKTDKACTNLEPNNENIEKDVGELHKEAKTQKSDDNQEAMNIDLNNTLEDKNDGKKDEILICESQVDAKVLSRAGSPDKENKEDGKSLNDETISGDKQDEAIEEICIVPDRMQESSSDSKDVNLSENENFESTPTNSGYQHQISNKELKLLGIQEVSNSSIEKNKSPSRPQRKAAQKAESQIKQVLLDNDDGVVEDDDDDDDVDVDLEEIRYDEDEEDREVDAVDIFQDNVVQEDEDVRPCTQCGEVKPCSINVITYGKTNYFCGENCFAIFRHGGNVVNDDVPQASDIPDLEPIPVDDDDDDAPMPEVEAEMQDIDNDNEVVPNRPTSAEGFIRKCSQCFEKIVADDKTLSWETMDFCDEKCLGKYQTELGSHCANCKGNVHATSLGKYCVRFGYDIKQFCCASCLEEFKKGLKVCSFCQKDISSGAEGFLAPVGDKGQFKDFCTQTCMEKYEQMSNNIAPPPETAPCNVCNMNKVVQVEVLLKNKVNKLCSEVCFAAFKFVNHLKVGKCDMCRKYFNKETPESESFSVFYDDAPHSFCSKTCMNVYILAKRKIVPCNWCKVKKYNFDMIKRIVAGQSTMMCSLNCLNLYSVSVNAVSSRRIKCDNCLQVNQAQYHLTMSDATIRDFCSYPCVINFQAQYSKTPITLQGNEAQPIPTGLSVNPAALPVISSVTSLAPNGLQDESNKSIQGSQVLDANSTAKTMYKQQILIKPPEPKVMCNKQTYTRPTMHTKGVSCRPHPCAKETQTEDDGSLPKRTVLIPVPVPIYVPTPMAMYSLPFPVPVPFPVPIPVPIFVPTTRNSANGILKQIKKIQEKMPTDPFEAELLMMAEMVADDKKEAESSSDGEEENEPVEAPQPSGGNSRDATFSPEAMESSNTFGDDMLQMALKMASELEGPTVDLEAALTPATITQPPPSEQTEGEESAPVLRTSGEGRGRKRMAPKASLKPNINANSTESGNAQKRSRRVSSETETPQKPPPPPPPIPLIHDDKPDVNFKLKYTFGVSAWRQWVINKNAELEKMNTNNRKVKLFKSEILQLTADELNYSLCLFLKEARKPNGQEYAPDTMYYLCLGIQQYLFENGRIDNIFTDSYYEKFTDCLDEIARKFTEIYDDRQYIVTRVEEEHLWESKQLGAHSPHVLLSTLMFFNTKYFNLSEVDEHMQLSFSLIMKHWKRNPNISTGVGGVAKVPGSRNVLLRFYTPQSAIDAPNSRKKKVYEQQENEENPLRCPVKLYEFYLSKCPESVRSRTDVFYLQPERSCVPDSPVWYSTMALGKEPLSKMLHRVKMVKEINIALLGT